MFLKYLIPIFYLIYSSHCQTYNKNRTIYSIELDASINILSKCIGPTGHVQTLPHYTVFLIYNRPHFCEDVLKNAAHDYIYNYYPTHTDVYKNEENTVSMKCDSKFFLAKLSETTTLLQSYCNE
ncbi:unnamed protein product [Bursaphelenchus xylophilus]|uniref:(pine wood nematode) hypothetical protein n=1 Tax=Bursaphelenchus xylophilus TaxID=6326 RepID=A0A1I7SV95_BURXY|nr:unnamed protein product [Bursaphelenchus xylophilus]CAG9101103.1 unnamed protein product [Bursaphelenchus xylophilus]